MKIQLIVTVTLVGLLAIACGAVDETPAATVIPADAPAVAVTEPAPESSSIGGQTTVTTEIRDFQHNDMTIQVGTTVTWLNQGKVTHTTTSGRPPEPTGLWNSGNLSKGQSSSHTFNQVGTFPYYCKFHSGTMRATITVVKSLAEHTPSAPTTKSAPGSGTDYY